MTNKLICLSLLLISVALASRNIITTSFLTGPTTAFGAAGSLHFKEQHSWSQGDSVNHILFEAFTDASNYFQILKNNTNTILFARNNAATLASYSCNSGTYTLNVGSMNSITITWPDFVGANAKIYINGTACATVTSAGTSSPLASGVTWFVGNRGSTGLVPWTGDIWDVGAWSTVLTAGNATTLATCGVHPSAIPTGLIQEWDLVGSSLLSQSGGSALTATGTTVTAICDPTFGTGTIIH